MEEKLLNRYLAKFDELNVLSQSLINKPNKTDNEFIDILIDAYVEGFASAEYMLGGDNKIDYGLMEKAIDKSYDGVSIQQKYEDYINNNDTESLNRLIENEYHRMYLEGQQDYASNFSDKSNYVKVWVTVGDDKVRDTHSYLEGMAVGIDEYFYTFDGDSARFPSDFGFAENNINCRCIVEYKKK